MSDGVVSEICVSVWNVEKNGMNYPPHRQNGGGAGKHGGICPPRQIDVGKNDWTGPLQQTENGVDDVSSRCFWVSLPLLHPPYASSDDSFLFHGPSLDPNHEKTHPSTASPSQP